MRGTAWHRRGWRQGRGCSLADPAFGRAFSRGHRYREPPELTLLQLATLFSPADPLDPDAAVVRNAFVLALLQLDTVLLAVGLLRVPGKSGVIWAIRA